MASTQQEEVEETYEIPAVKFATSGSLETIKSHFFKKEYEEFISAFQSSKFTVHKGVYSDPDYLKGLMEFARNNLLRGFPQVFDALRKYTMASFKLATDVDGTVSVTSYWITNVSDEDFYRMLGDDAELFKFTTVNRQDVTLDDMTAQDGDLMSYLH